MGVRNYTCHQCTQNQTAVRCNQSTKPQLTLGHVSESGVARRPNNFGYCTYVDRLFAFHCFANIVALKAFTSAKDVSESMAAIQATNKHGLWQLHNMKKSSSRRRDIVLCLCIGDGLTPQTAVLAYFLEK